MNNEINVVSSEIISSLVLQGDLSKLTPENKVKYYNGLCERIGLDPLTQPFKLLKLNGKEVLYADKGATQQLCKVYNISVEITGREKMEDVYIFTARAKDDKGRFADEIGAVTVGSLKGDLLANALMKASTKAKRRAVLAFCGLGMLDETETETIPGAIPAGAIETTAEKYQMTDDEAVKLTEWIVAAKTTEEKLCKLLKIVCIKDMTKELYDKAIVVLKETAEKRNGGAK